MDISTIFAFVVLYVGLGFLFQMGVTERLEDVILWPLVVLAILWNRVKEIF